MAKKEVTEWISKAAKDSDEAKFLLDNNRPLEDVAYFIHQSIEKFLKAFLISRGWELEKTHDLVMLVKEAFKFDSSFEKFIPAMEETTDFYIESRYPVGYEVEYTRELPDDKLRELILFAQFLKSKKGRGIYIQVRDSAEYVRNLRVKEGKRVRSGERFLEELIQWQKSNS